MFTKASTAAFVTLAAFLVGSTNGRAVPQMLNRRGGPVMCKRGVFAQEGDTCDTVAAANNVTPLALQAVNTILRPEFTCDPIETGIILCIPGDAPYDPVTDTNLPPESRTSAPAPTSTETPNSYPVICQTSVLSQPDDTCESVAAAYGVSVSDFYWTQVLLRPDFDCDNIAAGIYLCIPGQPPVTATPSPTP
ncbi:hypothetical protein FRC18_004560 [Serendipita sp. 400]|nr:hypothetical protein FRC18_004560 [Serendipita sp. 400]